MKFEIDVSGSDIFIKNYSICIAGNGKTESIIKGFKFKKDVIEKITENWVKGEYKYDITDKQKGFFKVRLYCIILHYLFKSINVSEKLSLTICRDFHGHKNDINMNLKYLLEKELKLTLGKPQHQKLAKTSNAHRYANLMYNDTSNKLGIYVNISLKDIEKYLIKKVTPKGLSTES